ncbi:MAG: hypothetical protein JSR78_00790 [Proteobacteria bacterium]|nr:hypothetical protein [Pseudomonadota bacterium]
MSDINSCMASFARLSSDERERSVRLIRAYNDAVLETQSTNAAEFKPARLFSWDEVEHLVKDYCADRLSGMGPAMEHYLSLLSRGYRWPQLD